MHTVTEKRFAAAGARIRAARLARFLTAEQVALQLHISVDLIGAWERGRLKVPENRLSKLADALCVSVGYLVNGDMEVEADLNDTQGWFHELVRQNAAAQAIRAQERLLKIREKARAAADRRDAARRKVLDEKRQRIAERQAESEAAIRASGSICKYCGATDKPLTLRMCLRCLYVGE